MTNLLIHLFETTGTSTTDTTATEASATTSTVNPFASWEDFGMFWYNLFLKPDASGVNFLTRIIIAIIVALLGWLLIKFIGWIFKKILKVNKGPAIDSSLKFFIITIIKVLLGIGVAFAVVSILGISITGFAGITSAITVALGLALQDLISCFASGVLILNQKFIKTGDYIMVQSGLGTCEGTIESIRFFFTHLVTPNGQHVTLPNNNVQKAIVTNFTYLGKRRLNYDVGVAYDTDITVAKETLYNLINDDPRILQDEVHEVYVYELGAYSVGLRIRCWTPVDKYWSLYNELSEKILLAFKEKGIYIPSSTDISVTKK